MSLNLHSSLVLLNIKIPPNLTEKREGEGTKPSTIFDGIQTSGQLILCAPAQAFSLKQRSDGRILQAEGGHGVAKLGWTWGCSQEGGGSGRASFLKPTQRGNVYSGR